MGVAASCSHSLDFPDTAFAVSFGRYITVIVGCKGYTSHGADCIVRSSSTVSLSPSPRCPARIAQRRSRPTGRQAGQAPQPRLPRGTYRGFGSLGQGHVCRRWVGGPGGEDEHYHENAGGLAATSLATLRLHSPRSRGLPESWGLPQRGPVPCYISNRGRATWLLPGRPGQESTQGRRPFVRKRAGSPYEGSPPSPSSSSPASIIYEELGGRRSSEPTQRSRSGGVVHDPGSRIIERQGRSGGNVYSRWGTRCPMALTGVQVRPASLRSRSLASVRLRSGTVAGLPRTRTVGSAHLPT